MKFAVQLYSLYKVIEKEGLFDVLKRIKEVGYHGVEFAGFYNYNIEEIKDIIDEIDLKTAGLHLSLSEIVKLEQLDKIVDLLNPPTITLPYLQEEYRNANINKIYGILNNTSSYLKNKNIKVCYHNHAFEFENNQDLLKQILNNTNAYAEPDIFWLTVAQKDSLEYIKSIKDRIGILHIKELGNDGISGKSPVIGQGHSKCLEVLKYAKNNLDIEWAVLECENIDDDYQDYLKKCLDIFKKYR